MLRKKYRGSKSNVALLKKEKYILEEFDILDYFFK
jgi:hypothetical protein